MHGPTILRPRSAPWSASGEVVGRGPACPHTILWLTLTALAFVPAPARASFLHGETLDTVADVISWVALIVAPIAGIIIFLMIHILPEKIAERRRHPQTKAIQTLCLLSLVFGGVLWPLAWLWAYSKPVLYKIAYGTDVAPEAHSDTPPEVPTSTSDGEFHRLHAQLDALASKKVTAADLQAMHRELATLEAKLKGGT